MRSGLLGIYALVFVISGLSLNAWLYPHLMLKESHTGLNGKARSRWIAPSSRPLRGVSVRCSVAKRVNGVSSFVDNYDAFLVDQFGVLHDGKTAYSDTIECMKKLRDKGKVVILLSNSSKQRKGSVDRMIKLGFPQSTFSHLITSGDLCWEGLSAKPRKGIFSNFLGESLLVFGNGDDDKDYLKDIGIPSSPEKSHYILARGTFTLLDSPEGSSLPDNAEQRLEVYQRYMHTSAHLGLKMLVSNPDLVRPDGKDSPMPGRLGEYYQSIGGEVTYVGKPYPLIYDHALSILREEFSITDPKRVCAIGDVMYTDIIGAKENNMDSALVLDGVHADDLEIQQGAGKGPEDSKLEMFFKNYNYLPTFAIDHFKW
ncbi:hypothetical protein AAMO2058_000338200 [Amorphochlora amoebiformis]